MSSKAMDFFRIPTLGSSFYAVIVGVGGVIFLHDIQAAWICASIVWAGSFIGAAIQSRTSFSDELLRLMSKELAAKLSDQENQGAHH